MNTVLKRNKKKERTEEFDSSRNWLGRSGAKVEYDDGEVKDKQEEYPSHRHTFDISFPKIFSFDATAVHQSQL